ncbi:MAG TPA: zinc ribbon domain-containing protein, partial [Firmicutes bacterium]|nr:zinc ribbon domain-containing protein [Bacillota bacterium]
MRMWLLIQIEIFLRWLLGTKKQAEEAVQEVEEPELPPCPICGEIWDKGEIFCYHCGYELKDENLPLNPPPTRTDSLTDPDNFLDEQSRTELGSRFSESGKARNWDIG